MKNYIIKLSPHLHNLELGAAVGGTALLGAVVGDGLAFAVALVAYLAGLDALRQQIVIHSFGAGQRQAIVVLVATLVVGVTANFNGYVVVLLEVVHQKVQFHVRGRLQVAFIEIKEDVFQDIGLAHTCLVQGNVLNIWLNL